MCQPTSTQGTRIITGDNYSSQYQYLFEQRINELIDESLAMRGERRCLHFSPQAARIWMDYYNDVESKMAVLGPLRDFREYAAKMQSIWQDWQDLFTILAVRKVTFPPTLLKWREN